MAVMRKSLHGREVGIASTGGLIFGITSTGGGSTALTLFGQMWGQALLETVSSNGATISNSGVTIISSDSTAGASFVLSAPVVGVQKEIHIQTPATDLNLGTSATTIYINTTLAEAAAGGSTLINIVGPATGIGGAIILRGLSTTQWSITSHTCPSSS